MRFFDNSKKEGGLYPHASLGPFEEGDATMAGISGTTYGTTCVGCGSTLSAASRIGKTFAETSGRNGDGSTALRSGSSGDSFYCASCAARNGSALQTRTMTSTSSYKSGSCPFCTGSSSSATGWTGGASTAKSSTGAVSSTAWAR